MDRTLERMLQKLSLPIRRQLQAVPASCWEQVQEIRLQQGREPYLVVAGRPMRLGQLLHRPISTEPVQPQQLQESFAALCDYSVHTCLPQLLEGYLTVEGGHRIGIGATAVIQNGRLCSVRQVSSLNLRIAHCIAHPASLSIEPLAEQLFSRGLCSVLVAGEPGSGKTTLLRSLSCWLAGRWKVTIVDERGELYEPNPSAQDGLCCMDFLRGFPKAQGVLQAVRTLSPQVIVCDELGDCEEVQQLLYALNTGVCLLASIHAGSREQLCRRQPFLQLQASGSLDRVLLLRGASHPGQVQEILEIHPSASSLEAYRSPRWYCHCCDSTLHAADAECTPPLHPQEVAAPPRGKGRERAGVGGSGHCSWRYRGGWWKVYTFDVERRYDAVTPKAYHSTPASYRATFPNGKVLDCGRSIYLM